MRAFTFHVNDNKVISDVKVVACCMGEAQHKLLTATLDGEPIVRDHTYRLVHVDGKDERGCCWRNMG